MVDSANVFGARLIFAIGLLEFCVGLDREIYLISTLRLNTRKTILIHSLFQILNGKYFPDIYRSQTSNDEDWKCLLLIKSVVKSRRALIAGLKSGRDALFFSHY